MVYKIIIFNYVLLSQSPLLSSFQQIVVKNLLGFDSMREVVVVPARICNGRSDFKRLIILAIDLVYIISDESICSIMEDNSRMICDVYDLIWL